MDFSWTTHIPAIILKPLAMALWAAMKGIMKNPVDTIAQFQVCSVRLNLGGDFMEELVEICGWLSQRANEGPARIQGNCII